MPWDVDRYLGNNADLPRKTIFSNLGPLPDPSLPSRLFRIPLDILQYFLERLTKQDAFRLSQTCKTFMWHPLVLKAICNEPISIPEIEKWYGDLPDCGMNKSLMRGPPVTWGINAFSGPSVRRMALPEWITEQDLHYLTAQCPNLDGVDFTELFESEPHPQGWETDEGDDDYDEEEEELNYWPSRLDRCPAFFRNLTFVHLPYGCWMTVHSRLHRYQQPRTASLPKVLSLAQHLQSLTIDCQQEPTRSTSPDTRRKASARLLSEILENVSRGLTTLTLNDSYSTIDNLESFLQSLSVFPKLRTIKLSLHRDLYIYQKAEHRRYDFDTIVDPILSSQDKDYEHDTASVRQYLAIIKRISDRERFSLVSTDCGEDFQYLPCEYYGLCQTELVLGPRDDLWAPVWTWNDRLDWVEAHKHSPSVETVDIEKCRALFEELVKARIPVAIELEPPRASSGAFFADPWVNRDEAGNTHNAYISHPPSNGAVAPVSCNAGQQPRQRFKQRRFLNTFTSNNALHELSYSDHKGRPAFHPLALAVNISLKETARQKKQRGEIADSNVNSNINSATSHITDRKNDIPNPVWRLNAVGDMVDHLRLLWDRRFSYVYAKSFAARCDLNPDVTEWSKLMHRCKTHLRDRLWREAEYTALLFRRIPVDFPRLTRLVLFIPTALYPDHDQTFIDRALPGTGWTVSHHSKHLDSVGGSYLPGLRINETCRKLAIDLCPFVRRVFTRPTPTDDPSAVIVHDEEWHVTRRPVFDLDTEYKSMEQLLTEPLRENYTMGDD